MLILGHTAGMQSSWGRGPGHCGLTRKLMLLPPGQPAGAGWERPSELPPPWAWAALGIEEVKIYWISKQLWQLAVVC